ncbi:MAG: hypothetical protein GF344_01830 [Chitinivibrionales bacterium]|nr:hypothetical protein [Chitinivibrionales bacterium]MBD3355833.1 hypothetical protein [Chitinivibrionales bacterium]
MNRAIWVTILCLTSTYSISAEQNFIIHLKSGDSDTIPAAIVESIVFSKARPPCSSEQCAEGTYDDSDGSYLNVVYPRKNEVIYVRDTAEFCFCGEPEDFNSYRGMEEYNVTIYLHDEQYYWNSNSLDQLNGAQQTWVITDSAFVVSLKTYSSETIDPCGKTMVEIVDYNDGAINRGWSETFFIKKRY